MIIKFEHFEGKNKEGRPYSAIKLAIGDYETLLFPRSRMELNYLNNIIDNGGVFDVDDM